MDTTTRRRTKETTGHRDEETVGTPLGGRERGQKSGDSMAQCLANQVKTNALSLSVTLLLFSFLWLRLSHVEHQLASCNCFQHGHTHEQPSGITAAPPSLMSSSPTPVYLVFEGSHQPKAVAMFRSLLPNEQVIVLEDEEQQQETLANGVTLYLHLATTHKVDNMYNQAKYHKLLDMAQGNVVFVALRQLSPDNDEEPPVFPSSLVSGINMRNASARPLRLEFRHFLHNYHDDHHNRQQADLLRDAILHFKQNRRPM